jgi:hypothetical protein
MPTHAKFDATDLELLTAVIDEIPNLTTVAQATRLVRNRLKFPIKKRDEILSLFDGKKTLSFGGRKVTVANVELFLLEKFFPIQSEQELIRKLIIAFQIGDYYHAEQFMQKGGSDDAPAETIPGPSYVPGAYLKLGRSRKGEK